MKHTWFIEHMATTHCNNDEEVKAMYNALETALMNYQWYYQNASDKKFVTVNNQTRKAVETTLELLRSQGHDSLISEIEYALQDSLDDSTLTKSKVITQAKRTMKSVMTEIVKQERYDNVFGKLMGEAFIEHCNTFQLDEAPEHFDLHFEHWFSYEPLGDR